MTKEEAAEKEYPYTDVAVDNHTRRMLRRETDKYREGYIKGWEACEARKQPVIMEVKKNFNSWWTVCFTIGVQGFNLGDLESEERAIWYKRQLEIAFSNLAPLPPAGPVWVKCSHKFPEDWITSIIRMIDSKTLLTQENIKSVEPDYFQMESGDSIPFYQTEWLDESNPPAQVFTREQLNEIVFKWGCWLNGMDPEKTDFKPRNELFNIWFNTNYPETKP